MNAEKIRRWFSISLTLVFCLYVYIAFNAAFVNDDYMALYSTWLISTGKVASVDFHVDSYTLLFDWLAPVYYLVGEHFENCVCVSLYFHFIVDLYGVANHCHTSSIFYDERCISDVGSTVHFYCNDYPRH